MEQPPLRHGLIDTDILIDASRGFSQAGEFLNEMHAGGGVTTSVIAAMELAAGCRDSAQLADVKQLLATFTIAPLTEPISTSALNLMASFTLSNGLLLPDAPPREMVNDLVRYCKSLQITLNASPCLRLAAPSH